METDMDSIQIKKRKDTFIEIDKLATDKRKYWQIDFLKVFAMALVILDHSTSHDELFRLASPLWERIAIPIFMIVLGFNWSKSMEKRKNEPLYKLYSWRHYFKKKIVRFGIPFGAIYVLSGLFFIIIKIFDIPTLNIGNYGEPILKFWLFLPVWGPGNWFIPTLFLTILVFPIMYKAFTKQPALALIGCFILEIFYQLFIYGLIVKWYNTLNPSWNLNNAYTFLICTPFVLLSAIGLGIWFSQNYRWDSLHNIIVYFLGIISFIYLYLYTFVREPETRLIGYINGDYNHWVYPWSALLVLIALNVLPKEPYGKKYRFISLLSSSTYHILMTQIFYFSIIYNLFLPIFDGLWGGIGLGENYFLNYLWYYPFNLALTFSIGTLWYKLEEKYIWDKVKRIERNRLKLLKAKGW